MTRLLGFVVALPTVFLALILLLWAVVAVCALFSDGVVALGMVAGGVALSGWLTVLVRRARRS